MTKDPFAELPAPLSASVARAWGDFQGGHPSLAFADGEREAKFYASLGKVWAASPFVAEQCLRTPELLRGLVESGRLFSPNMPGSYRAMLHSALQGTDSEDQIQGVLRRYRNREMTRIAWRDIAGWAPLEETLADLTALAECCLDECLEYLYQQACRLRGTPLNRSGEPQRLVVLGMGKLGAWELNFSSDIDLIFAYEEDGVLPDKKQTSYGEFYTRLARSLLKALDEVTADGFVFRVDTRLRPFGDSGPLVMNFDGMEHYYLAQAREWERYAMVKARVVAGDFRAGQVLLDLLQPFVYRRYLDFRAFGELRQLKQKITRELQRQDRMDNVKLGPGGIREIEFIGQAFQLIRGGREKRLRERRILVVLDILGELRQLPIATVAQLKAAYHFLRRVENRIQQYGDRQTHELPTDAVQRLGLAYALGFPDWNAFRLHLDEVRAGVHDIFGQVIKTPGEAGDEEPAANWMELDDPGMAAALTAMGYADPAGVLPLLAGFRDARGVRRITARGAAELNRIMPRLLRAVAGLDNAGETLGRILTLLEAIAGRNVYFTLLAENPTALSQLVKLAAASSWIVNYIAANPLLLDELLDPRALYSPLSLEQLRRELGQRLEALDGNDIEQLMLALRQFKQANELRIAAADIMGVAPVMVVSDYLSWLAEAIIGAVLEQAWRLTAQRHGVPPGAGRGEIKGFGVIAYGKLGGLELSYASDLDLVFLYGGVEDATPTDGDHPIPCAQFYARVAKRMITLLTTQLLAGSLYQIDLRLRPSGSSGLLVSSLEAYETYQLTSAWTWEQQALVRARWVAGDPAIGESFAGIRRNSLGRKRDVEALRREVREMRERMRENLASRDAGLFDLKQGQGGIADIEFIVQFGILSEANDHQDSLRWTDVVRLLDSLRATGFLSAENAELLRQAYCLYRERTHRAALLEAPAMVPVAEYAELRCRVQAIWREIMERQAHP